MIDLVKVKVEGTWFLCSIVYQSGSPTTLENAIQIGDNELTGNLDIWIMQQNIGELKTVIIGKNQGFIKTDLSVKEQTLLNAKLARMTGIKKHALQLTENDLYIKGNVPKQ